MDATRAVLSSGRETEQPAKLKMFIWPFMESLPTLDLCKIHFFVPFNALLLGTMLPHINTAVLAFALFSTDSVCLFSPILYSFNLPVGFCLGVSLLEIQHRAGFLKTQSESFCDTYCH